MHNKAHATRHKRLLIDDDDLNLMVVGGFEASFATPRCDTNDFVIVVYTNAFCTVGY